MVAWPLMSRFPQVFWVREKLLRCWVKLYGKNLTSWEGYRGFMTGHQQPSAKYRKGFVGSFGSTPVAFLAGVSNIFYMFTPKIGEDSDFDSYFSKGLVQPPTSFCCNRKKSNGKQRKKPRSCDPKTRAHNRTWWFKAFLTSCRKVQLGTLSVSNMQWIAFFVADTVDGSEVRDHHRKDTLYKTLWIIGWHMINYQPQLVSHRRILNEPSTVCQQFRIRVKVGSLHVVFPRNKTHRTVITSPNVTASG